MELVELHDHSRLAKRASVSACDSCCGKLPHDNPALVHTVLQLWPSPPISHLVTPAAVHASSVELAMLLLKPTSPGATTNVKEPSWYLPTPQNRHALTPVVAEYFPALQSTQVALFDAPDAAEYLPMPHPTHVAADDCPD